MQEYLDTHLSITNRVTISGHWWVAVDGLNRSAKMKVSIKDLSVSMEVKNKGVEFGVHDNNGKRVNWDKFIEWIENK